MKIESMKWLSKAASAKIFEWKELNKEDKKLLNLAKKARKKAQTPYSNHWVGAAVLCENGKIYAGCNVERATFTQTTHAEQNAIKDVIMKQKDVAGAIIFFTRIDENKRRTSSNRLCCTICSRAVLDAGVSEFILEWEDGTVRSWPADEFNQLSYEYKTPVKK